MHDVIGIFISEARYFNTQRSLLPRTLTLKLILTLTLTQKITIIYAVQMPNVLRK